MLQGDPPRSVPLSSWGTSLSGALGRVTLFSERPERSLPLRAPKRGVHAAGARVGI